MPPMCAVPHCQTGSRYSRSINQTCPMFNIPRNESLKRKWEEAIPGNINLKYGQLICAKHFLENEVIAKCDLKDKSGNVTGKQAYKKPRLKENAVPSIFFLPICLAESDSDSNSKEHNYSINRCKIPNDLKNAEKQDDNSSEFKNSSDIGTLQNSIFDKDLLKIMSKNVSKVSVDKEKQNIIYDNDLINVIYRGKSNILDVRNVKSIDHNESNNHSTNESSACTEFQFADINSMTNESNSSNISCSLGSIASCNINNNVDYENDKDILKQNKEQNNPLQVKYKSVISINNKEIEIPKSWSLIHTNIDNHLTLIFIHSVSEIINESENKEKIKKYVTYNCLNGNTRYFAHGKEVVDVYKDHLLPRLRSADLLVKTLLNFEKMTMCKGLKEEYMPYTIVGEYYMDKFNTWRTIQCTLLTRKFKKCEYCRKLIKKLFERKTRWLQRLETGSKFHGNAFKLNAEYRHEVDLNKKCQKQSGLSTEDEYIEEIDSCEFLNYRETNITKIKKTINKKRQKCSNDRIKNTASSSDMSLPITFKFLFKKEQ